MASVRISVSLTLIAVLFALSGCGVNSGAQPGAGAPDPATPHPSGPGAAALPPPSALHGASYTQRDLYRWGSEYGDALPHNLVARDSLQAVFTPQWTQPGGQFSDLAYAMYKFQLDGFDLEPKLHFVWGEKANFSAGWVGLANFQRDRWDWHRLPASGQLAFDAAKHISIAGAMYVVVLCTGEEEWRLIKIWVGLMGAPGAWSMFGHDIQQTRRSQYVGSQAGVLRWKFRTNGDSGYLFSDVLVGPDGTLYVGSGPDLHALNRDGSVKWYAESCHPTTGLALGAGQSICFGSRNMLCLVDADGIRKTLYVQAGDGDFATPVVAGDGTVYAICGNKLYAISGNGQLKWYFAMHNGYPSVPAVGPDQTVYIGEDNPHNNLYAINPNGSLKWRYGVSGAGGSSPAVGSDGTVYVGTGNDQSKLLAINPDGSLKWSFDAGGSVHSPAIGIDGTVYVGCHDNWIYAVAPDGRRRWAFRTGGYITSRPAVSANGTVYVNSHDGKLYCLNSAGRLKWIHASLDYIDNNPVLSADGVVYLGSTAEDAMGLQLNAIAPDGSVLWSYTTGAAIQSSAAIGADGSVYVGCTDGRLYAVSPDGGRQWAYDANSQFLASPAIGADGTVYIGTNGGTGEEKLLAINSDGTLQWDCNTSAPIKSSPVVGEDGMIYVSSSDGNLHAVDADGKLQWIYYTGHDIGGSSPAIGMNQTIYVCNLAGELHAVNPDGTWKWNYRNTAPTGSSPAVGMDGTIYFCNTSLYAIMPDGNLKWTYYTGYSTSSLAIGADGAIFVGTQDNALHAINPDGTSRWIYTAGDQVVASPAIGADGTVYAGSYDGELFAVDSSGNRRWRYRIKDIVTASPAIGADGTVYIGSYDGKLYAFRK